MRAFGVALLFVAACGMQSGQPATSPPSVVAPSVTPAPTSTPEPAQPSPTTNSPTITPQPPIAAIAPIFELRSSIAREPAGRDRLAGVATLADADAEFAFNLYHEIAASEPGNLFFSPYSISTALSMALAGARGNTATEMRLALGVGEDDEAWHDARNRLELALSSLEERHLPSEGEAEPLTLEPTNAIFGQADYAFRDEFLDLLAGNYGAGMQAVDFVANPEAARLGINEWVAEQTRDRIEELLKQGSITLLTRAVLVNAIYFKGNWIYEFNPENTSSEPFHLLNGSTRNVQMMHASPEGQYASGQGWAAVELPYWGGASMIVVVPDEGRFDDVERRLDAAFVEELNTAFTEYEVHLSLPRWESELTLGLVPSLQELGIHEAFVPGLADLSGVADFTQTGEPLYVADVIHQANITVDEEGTEAAAATAVLVFAVCRCGPPEVTLTVDRPFIYLIRDEVTGEILFVGRLLEP